jgi:hydroxymethylglutaryl-CoA lyase
MCEQMGIATGIDLERLLECVDLAERIFGRALPGHLGKGGLFRAQRPAGWAAQTQLAASL